VETVHLVMKEMGPTALILMRLVNMNSVSRVAGYTISLEFTPSNLVLRLGLNDIVSVLTENRTRHLPSERRVF
jgi:hypothetical protein